MTQCHWDPTIPGGAITLGACPTIWLPLLRTPLHPWGSKGSTSLMPPAQGRRQHLCSTAPTFLPFCDSFLKQVPAPGALSLEQHRPIGTE